MGYNENSSTAQAIADSLISDRNTYLEETLERLNKETLQQGLRNSDMAELTGWSPSKTSKIMAGKQNLTAEDVRTWARVLGYTPDPFISKQDTRRSYAMDKHVRDMRCVFEAYIKSGDNTPEHNAIVNYELPLSILSMLKVNVSDYVVKASPYFWECDLSCPPRESETASTYVSFVQRNTITIKRNAITTNSKQPMIEFGVWISPKKDYFLFILYFYDELEDDEIEEMRTGCKKTFQVDPECTKKFDVLSENNKYSMPVRMRKGEIFSIGWDSSSLPELKELNDAMMQIFKFYCELVWNQYGIDAFPSRYKEIEPDEDIDAFQLWEIVKGGGDFTPEVREEIAERGEYTCENDPSHKTFPDPCGGNYIDVVPIVPFSSYPQFGKSVLSACNGACLCPMCKAQMRYGSRDAREDIIIKLYRKRQQEMEESGMQVSLAQVLSLNSLS